MIHRKILRRRPLRFETLEQRALLVAEAETFSLTRAFDAVSLAGTPSATVLWGDGTQSAATVTGGTTTGSVRIRFDYSLDTSGFFADANRRAILNAAASIVTSRLGDSLAAIQPTATNTWTARTLHPVTGAVVDFPNAVIAANEIVIYVGARRLGNTELGSGGPGGFAANCNCPQSWIDNVQARGQAGGLVNPRTDFGPWGGTVAFDSAANFYFGLDPAGLQANQHDFLTVATHEVAHVLGFGIPSSDARFTSSWTRLVSGGTFTGTAARAANGGANVPLSSTNDHWLESLSVGGQTPVMGPIIAAGARDIFTRLDLGALDDIGWDVLGTSANLTAQHVYADNGSYPITINYRGSGGGSFTQTAVTTATITNTNPTLTVSETQNVITNQVLRLTNLGSISDPGFANPAATPPTAETFTYSVTWGDGSAADTGAATIDRNGTATAPTLASFDGTHTYTTAGTFTVTVRANDDDNGSAQRTFQVVVSPPPQLSLVLNRASIAENVGAAAATLTVTRSAPAATTATTINITSSDTTEATVPASVAIPAGQLSITVPVSAVDDALLDGTQSVTLTAAGSGLINGTTTLAVTDVETLTASFTAAAIFENAAVGSFALTVRRSNTDNSQPLTVNIAGNVPSQITVPTTATIPAGSAAVSVPVQPINDDLAERPLSLVFRFTAAGYVGDDENLILIDDEPNVFQNPDDPFDVDGDGSVIPRDALRIINALTRRGMNFVLDPATDDFGTLFPDVNGDYRLTALDALRIINEITRLRRPRMTGPELAAPSEDRLAAMVDAAILDLTAGELF